jgi:hypothetical protein
MEVFIDLRTLAELLGISHSSVRGFRHPAKNRPDLGFPPSWGAALRPGQSGQPAPVFALSEVLDWIAEHRPYDLRIALEFGNVGHELGRLEERHNERRAAVGQQLLGKGGV